MCAKFRWRIIHWEFKYQDITKLYCRSNQMNTYDIFPQRWLSATTTSHCSNAKAPVPDLQFRILEIFPSYLKSLRWHLRPVDHTDTEDEGTSDGSWLSVLYITIVLVHTQKGTQNNVFSEVGRQVRTDGRHIEGIKVPLGTLRHCENGDIGLVTQGGREGRNKPAPRMTES